MADSTVTDVSKMKVVDLRKELKSRGLSHTGDKAELVARLQSAMSEDNQDDHGDINLDSDEIDSDGVLEDEDDSKSHTDILDDTNVDTLNEELALAEQTTPFKPSLNAKPPRILKRKITSDSKSQDKEIGSKKIILNRTISTQLTSTQDEDKTEKEALSENTTNSTDKVKITCNSDAKSLLESRAKRFGLPIKMTEAERKEARKLRFGQSDNTITSKLDTTSSSLSTNLEKLKQRAQRFGQSVSKIMTDIENKEKLERRKAKFNVAQ